MRQVELKRRAQTDLDEVVVYLAERNPSAARRFVQMFHETALHYAEYPGMGNAKPKLGSDIRSFVVQSYVAFHRPSPDGITVLRVLHGARRITRKQF